MRSSTVWLSVALFAFLAIHPMPAQAYDRESRVRFDASLPPNCASGWNGRGIGVVAICMLANRVQARFIDGRIVVCGAMNCADRAAQIDAYLRMRGF
jgi:hypothetical protein